MGAEVLDNEAEHCDRPTTGLTVVVQTELPQSSGLACGIQSICRLQVNQVPSCMFPRRVGHIVRCGKAPSRNALRSHPPRSVSPTRANSLGFVSKYRGLMAIRRKG